MCTLCIVFNNGAGYDLMRHDHRVNAVQGQNPGALWGWERKQVEKEAAKGTMKIYLGGMRTENRGQKEVDRWMIGG